MATDELYATAYSVDDEVNLCNTLSAEYAALSHLVNDNVFWCPLKKDHAAHIANLLLRAQKTITYLMEKGEKSDGV